MRAADLGDRLAQLLLGGAGAAQEVARPSAEAGEAEQQVLGGDVLVAELAHLDLGRADDAEQLGGGRGLLGGGERGERVDGGVDLDAQGGPGDPELAQDAGDHGVVLAEQDREQVLGRGLRVLARGGQGNGGLDGLLGLDGEAVGVQGSCVSLA